MNAIKYQRWVVVLSSALLFFYSFMQLNIINSISALLMREFSLNATQLGNLSSLYFYANCLFLLPAGLLLDRFSVRKLNIFALIATIIGVFCFAFAPDVFVAGVGRFLTGLGGAFCFLCCMCLAARWFPPKQLALVTGCLLTMSMSGGLMAQAPMALLTQHYGWRFAMELNGFLGIIFLVLTWLFVKDHPPEYQVHGIQRLKFLESIRTVFFSVNNWLNGLFIAFINLPIFLLGALWGNLYLVQVANLTHAQAAYVMTMLFVGTIFGSPLIGGLSDKLSNRRLFMMMSAVLGLVIILLIIYMPHLSLLSFIILFFMLGFVAGSQALGFSVVTTLNPKSVTGTVNSLMSMVLIASGFIFQPFFGWLMELSGRPKVFHHLLIYTRQDFHYGMLIMPIAFALSLIIAWLIKETAIKNRAN